MKETQYQNYFVSKDGDVFSTKFNKVKKLKPRNNGKGYMMVSLSSNNKVKQMLVHRLIAETFIANPQNKPAVNHKNGIKSDNRLENLEWVTPKENMDHAISIGLANNSGANNGTSKLTEVDVIQIRELYVKKNYTFVVLAKMFNVSFQQISNIINKKKWKHI